MSSILSQSSWWVINKAVTKKLGLDASVLLSDLISKQEYFKNRSMLDLNGFFFNTREEIERDTTIPLYRQNKAIERLKELEILEVHNKGVPPKTRFRVNELKLKELIIQIVD